MSTFNHSNPATGREFKAVSLSPLDRAMVSGSYVAAQWATWNQWQTVGRQVRKGEHGTMLIGASGFQWRVFNIAQTDKVGDAPDTAKPAPAVKPAATPKAKPARKERKATATATATAAAPTVPATPTAQSWSFVCQGAALLDALRWTRRAASNEETRYYLNGVFFNLTAPATSANVELCATDGHRMHLESVTAITRSEGMPSFIMPRDMAATVCKALAKSRQLQAGRVAVHITRDQNRTGDDLLVSSGSATLGTGTAIEGTFPDYGRVIPRDTLKPVTLDMASVHTAIRLAREAAKARDVAAGNDKRRKADRSAPVVLLTGETATAYQRDKAVAGPHAYVNGDYLADTLAMGENGIALAYPETGRAHSPMILRNAAGRRAVLMPMRAENDSLAAHPGTAGHKPVKIETVNGLPSVAPAAVAQPQPAAPVVAPAPAPSIDTRAAARNVSPETVLRETPRPAPAAPAPVVEAVPADDLTPPAFLRRGANLPAVKAPAIRQPAAPEAAASARASWVARIKAAVAPRPQA